MSFPLPFLPTQKKRVWEGIFKGEVVRLAAVHRVSLTDVLMLPNISRCANSNINEKVERK